MVPRLRRLKVCSGLDVVLTILSTKIPIDTFMLDTCEPNVTNDTVVPQRPLSIEGTIQSLVIRLFSFIPIDGFYTPIKSCTNRKRSQVRFIC